MDVLPGNVRRTGRAAQLLALLLLFAWPLPVLAQNAAPTGAPVIIAGDEPLAVGRTLSVATSGIMDLDGLSNPGFTYQWLADDVEISGATGSTYELTAAVEGKVIKVRVSFTDDGSTQETLTGLLPPRLVVKAGQKWVYRDGSVEYDVVLPAVVTEALVVSVASSDMDVTVSPSSLTFAAESWNMAQRVTVSVAARTGATLTGEGRATLTHTAAGVKSVAVALTFGEEGELRLTGYSSLGDFDRGLEIWLKGRWGSICEEHFTRADGEVACRQLGYTHYRSHELPFRARVNDSHIARLDCTGTEDRLVDCPYTYEPFACAWIQLTVTLKCHNPATGAPTVSGTFGVGHTLTADIYGIMDGDGLSDPGFTYQWLADGQAISGATRSTYMLTAAEQGKQISVRVRFTDDSGNRATKTSAAGGPVSAMRDINVAAAMPLQVQEGGSVAYTVWLNAEPTASVTVTVSTSDTDVTVSPSSLTFTTESWGTVQTVTVSAGQDTDEDKESVTLTHAASGADYGSVTAVEVLLAVFDDEATPGRPTGLSASADGPNEIDLEWTAPVEVASVPVTGYRIEVSEDGGANWTDAEADTSSTDTDYAHTDLTPGTTYRYRVSAISAGGTGIASAEASATTAEGGVCGRSAGIVDALFKKADVNRCNKVTAAHLASWDKLWLWAYGTRSAPLKAGDFAGMTNLKDLSLSQTRRTQQSHGYTHLPAGIFQDLPSMTMLDLSRNRLRSPLPDGLFDGLTNLRKVDLSRNNIGPLPDGIFVGLNLTSLHLGLQGNSQVNVSLPIRLEKVGEDSFKAVAPTGAPLSIDVPISGAIIEGGGTSVTIPAGSRESEPVRVWSLTGATAEVVVGSPLPANLPSGHSGYDLVGSADAVEVSATEQWSVAISPAAITELGPGAATVTVDAGEHLSSESHPFVLEIGGTAEAGADYTVTDSRGNVLSSPYSMTLPGGSRSVTTTVTAVDDTIEESGETIEVTLLLRGSLVARETITITDDDAGRPAQVTITGPDETLEEGAEALFTLTRSGLAVAALTVSVEVAGAEDFVPAGDLGTRTVTFGAGVASATMTVATIDDGPREHDSTITATVGSGDDYVAHATQGSASVGVIDNNWRLMVTVPSLEVSVTEPGDFLFNVYGRPRPGADRVLTNVGDLKWYARVGTATEADVELPIFGAPQDLVFQSFQYARQADGNWLGTHRNTYFARVKQDDLVEGDETLIMHLVATPDSGIWLPQAENGLHLRIPGTIVDDDVAVWSLSIAPAAITEGRAETGAVKVSVSRRYEREVHTATLELSGTGVEGTDYTVGSKSLTLGSKQRSVQTGIASLYNGQDTGDKTVIVTAKRAGGEVIGTGTLTIRNNHTRPGAPTGLSASAEGSDRINLSWTAPEDAGGLPVSGYLIEVSEDMGSNWADVEEDTESTETTYVHTGLTGGSTYRYRVSANSVGGPGAASVAASATTTLDVACGRSEGVREAIVTAAGVEGCGKVTAAQVLGITELEVDFEPLVLKAGDFAGLTGLVTLRLDGNRLSALPPGIFTGLTRLVTLRLDGNELSELPPGILTGLTGLTTLDLRNNPNTPLPVTVLLEKVGEDGIKAVASTGAPFGLTVEVGLENGETAGGESEVELSIAAGAEESGAVAISRSAGTTGAVTAAIEGFSSLPTNHDGYELTAGGELEVLPELPEVGIAAGASPVTEGTDRHAEFGLTRTGAVTEVLTVTVTVGQTGDFAGVTGPVTVRFGAGDAEAALKVAIVDDAVKEFEGGNVTATLAAVPGSYVLGEDVSAEVRVLDDDARVRVSWEAASVSVGEGEGTVVLGAVAETAAGGTAPGAFEVTATAEAVTAVAGGDYTAAAAAVTFAPADFTAGVAQKALTVTMADDAVHEAEETFEWKLSAAASAPVAFEDSTAVVTVVDDDPEPQWAVTIEPAEVVEGGSAVVSVVSSNGSVFAEEQTVTLTFGGTAEAGTDYTAGSTSVTLGAEAGTSGTMTLTTVDDSDEEPDKTVEVVARIGEKEIARRSLLLRDNEVPNTTADGNPAVTGLAQVGRLLTADTSGITDADGLGNVVYEYQWVRRDGTEEVDIAGATAASYRPVGVDVGRMLLVRVSFTDDGYNAETATSVATEAVAGLPEVGIGAESSPVTEGTDTRAVFGLTRTGPTSEALTVTVTVGQTGEFITAPGPMTVTFGVGDAGVSLSVAIADDAVKEFAGGSVTAAVEPGTETTYEAGAGARAEVRVLDDDAIVRVSWAAASVSVGEGDGTAELEAVAETAVGAGAPGAFVVAATAEAGTAVAGEDYTVTTAAVTFEPGDFTGGDEGQRVARKALTVAIVDDTVNETAAESFEWVLSAGAGEATGFDGDGARLAVAAVTIEDDDAAPAWEVEVRPERIEEGESATVRVVSTTAFAEERVATLRFGGNATEGSDYTVGSRSLTIAAGAGESGSVTLTSIDDEGDEPDETVVVIAELDGGVIGRRSLVLEDNDEPANVAAAGAPVISGRAHAGRTLMADTSGIADEDGLGDVEYEYQWIRGDDEIAEATGAAYELTEADVGRSVRVRVTFTDDRGHEEVLESVAVAVTAAPAVTVDVNGDGTIDADDALVMYYAYRFSSDLGDGEEGGFEESRRAQLGGLSGVSNPTDEDLKALLWAANAWRSGGLDAGGDVNGDGMIDADDALVMYYAYAYRSQLGNGDAGGFEEYRQAYLRGLSGESNPTDADLRALLRAANALRGTV